MKEVSKVVISLLEDKDSLKYRVNIISKNKVIGWLKPVEEAKLKKFSLAGGIQDL